MDILGSPSLIVLIVSVVAKQHLKKKSGERQGSGAAKSEGGRPWLPVPNSPHGLCGCKATFEEEEWGASELRNCEK